MIAFLQQKISVKHTLALHAALFLGVGFARGKATRVSRETPVKKSKIDLTEKLLLTSSIIGYMGPIFYGITKLWIGQDKKLIGDYKRQNSLTMSKFLLGAATMCSGVYLLWRSHVDLGRNFSKSLELRESHKLVREGVYTKLIHPMYTSMLLLGLSFPLTVNNHIAGASYIVSMIALLISRVKKEEAMMKEEFSNEWDEFVSTRWRFIPYVF